jgi:hypothetical protein
MVLHLQFFFPERKKGLLFTERGGNIWVTVIAADSSITYSSGFHR